MIASFHGRVQVFDGSGMLAIDAIIASALMDLIKHSCTVCNSDLEFPELVERVRCPRCGSAFLVEQFEGIVSLKQVKEESAGAEADPLPLEPPCLSPYEEIQLLDGKIEVLNRHLLQNRRSAFSSLSVAFLFFFIALVWLLAGRDLIAIFCGIISMAMAVVAAIALRDSARLRSSLTALSDHREQLAQELRVNMPRIF